MRKRLFPRHELIDRLLCLLLAVALVLQGMPIAPAYAIDALSAITTEDDEAIVGETDALCVADDDETDADDIADATADEEPVPEADDTDASKEPALQAADEDAPLEAAEEPLVMTGKKRSAALEADGAAIANEEPSRALSTTFYFRGQRGNSSRTALVTFVDQFRRPIMGTVTGTVVINYADGTTDYPNKQDMYEYGNMLDPNIDGTYEFSRVYLTLGNDDLGHDEKEFRYFCVSTDKDNHGSGGTATRLYTYMSDIDSETASTGVYNGMWYTLPNSGNGRVDNTYIEFNRVSEVTFRAIDETGEPVEGATFALYSDANCYRTYEYKGVAVQATSDRNGVVSFGMLPYNKNDNTYYMKEITVPEGYKDEGTVYEVKAEDGVTNPDIVHYEDDGSVILSNIKTMTVRATWADGEAGHENDEVAVKLYSQGVEQCGVTLSQAANNWEASFDDLNHTSAYVVTEKSVTRDGEDITARYIPQISYVRHYPAEVGYYKSEDFQTGKDYVLVSPSGLALASTSGKLVTKQVGMNGDMLSGTIDSSMLWYVVRVDNDGVIDLQNVATGRHLNYLSSGWGFDANAPKFVRSYNSGGKAVLYYRTNMNASKATYLVAGSTISTTTSYASATNFGLYQEIEVQSVTVTVRNRSTVYPVRIQNMVYHTDETLAGGTYALYTDSEFEGHMVDGRPVLEDMEPVYDEVHAAGDDGYLTAAGSREFKLWADTYYLVQRSTPDGYLPMAPKWMKFTVTRGGAVRVEKTKEQFPDYTYVSSDVEGSTTYPKLRVPNQRVATLELEKALFDDSLDAAAVAALRFDFEAELTNALGQTIAGWTFADGVTTDENGRATLTLTADEVKALEAPVGDTLVVRETSQGYVVKVAQDGGDQVRTRSWSFVVPGESRVTFANIRPICKIEDDGVEQPFESLNAAVDYAREHMAGEQAVIEMLVDYEQPANDVVAFADGDDFILTTAAKPSAGDGKVYHYTDDGHVATIARAHGGGSMLGGCGTLELRDVTLDGGGDAYGSLVLNGGILSWSAGSLVLGEGTTLTNAKVVAGGVGLGAGLGGAVYVSGSATLTMTGASIVDCAAASGGGVYATGTGLVSMTDGEVSRCTAVDDGGAFWVGTGSSLTIAGTAALEDNVAGARGGGVYATGTDVALTDAYVGSATADQNDSIYHNVAGEGGGIYFDAAGKAKQLTVANGASIRRCAAQTGSGGGIYAVGGTVLLSESAEIVTCSALVAGGGIFATGGAQVTLDGPCDQTSTHSLCVYDCSAGEAGGCVALADGSASSLAVLRGSAVLLGTVTEAGGRGGGVYAGTGTSVVLDGNGAEPRDNGKVEPAYIAWCRANAGQGGGLYAADGAVVSLVGGGQIVNNGTAQGNVARAVQGGGVYVAADAVVSVGSGSQVAKNEAGEGGGLYVEADGSVVLSSDSGELAASVHENRAMGCGAGVYLSPEAKLQLAGLVEIDRNTTGTGNLYLPTGMTGSEVEVTGDLTAGSVVYVWAVEAARDGVELTTDEQFGVTTAARSLEVAGLESFVSERAEVEESERVTGVSGIGNAVVWGKRATAEMRLEVAGDYADRTKKFAFELTMPKGVDEVRGSVNGVERTFTPRDNRFELADGEVLVLELIQAYMPHTLTQLDAQVAVRPSAGDRKYDPTARVDEAEGSSSTMTLSTTEGNARVVTFNEIVSSEDDPARLVITNTLNLDDVPQTGLDDNALVWLGIVAASALGLAALYVLRRRRAAR